VVFLFDNVFLEKQGENLVLPVAAVYKRVGKAPPENKIQNVNGISGLVRPMLSDQSTQYFWLAPSWVSGKAF
jgi:hypothetical protein